MTMAEKKQLRYLKLICTFRDPVVGQQRSSFFCKIVERNLNTEALYMAGAIPFKDGAYYCYGAYVLRISRCSDFL